MNETKTLVNEINENIKDKSEAEKREYLEELYNNGLLTERVLDFLINEEICIDYLAHLPLSNVQLLKLFNKNRQVCAEAAFTIIDRGLEKETSIEDFNIAFSNCCNEEVGQYLLTTMLLKPDIDDVLINKYLNAIRYIRENCKYDEELFEKAIEFENFIKLRFTDDIAYIKECYKKKNYIYNIAISQNDNTPIEIINELCLLKEVKYSKIIRANAVGTKKRKSVF